MRLRLATLARPTLGLTVVRVASGRRTAPRGHTLIVGNRAKRGGGMCSSVLLSVVGHVVIRGNHSSVTGGGVSVFNNGEIHLRQASEIRGNRTEGDGGGVGGDIGAIKLQ